MITWTLVDLIKCLFGVVNIFTSFGYFELRGRPLVLQLFPSKLHFFALLKIGAFVQGVCILCIKFFLFSFDYDVLALSTVPTGDNLVLLVFVKGVNGYENLVKFVGG